MLVGRKTLKAQSYLELKHIFTGKPVMTSKCKLHYLKRYRFKTKDQVIASIKGKLNIEAGISTFNHALKESVI